MQPEKSNERCDRFDAALALLRTVCDELHCLAYDIAHLGESLTSKDATGSPLGMTPELQFFDPFSQRALAQARLLRGIECLLAGKQKDWMADVDALIQAVPFHENRQRLFAAIQGQTFNASNSDLGYGEDLELF